MSTPEANFASLPCSIGGRTSFTHQENSEWENQQSMYLKKCINLQQSHSQHVDDQKASPPNSTVLFEQGWLKRDTVQIHVLSHQRTSETSPSKVSNSNHPCCLHTFFYVLNIQNHLKVVNPVIFENNPQYYPNGW